jgi:hypothetical protein
MQRILEIVLIVIIAIGGAFLLPTLRQRYQLQREHDRLVQTTGSLPIADPTKVHIRAIDTGEPLHFAWQAYFPPNYTFSYTTKSGSGSSARGKAVETTLRVRIREVDGRLMVYKNFGGGGGGVGGGSGQLIEWLKEHPDALQKFRVEQFAAEGLVVFNVAETHTLLKVSLPPDLLAEAKKKLDKREYDRIVPNLECIRFGPAAHAERDQAAKMKKKAAGSGS